MDAAVPVDAKNAPTGTWKTAKTAVSHTAHTHHRYTGEQRQKNRAFNRLTHEIPDTPRDYVSAGECQSLCEDYEEIERMTTGLIRHLQREDRRVRG
jgi:hypothetical protein